MVLKRELLEEAQLEKELEDLVTRAQREQPTSPHGHRL